MIKEKCLGIAILACRHHLDRRALKGHNLSTSKTKISSCHESNRVLDDAPHRHFFRPHIIRLSHKMTKHHHQPTPEGRRDTMIQPSAAAVVLRRATYVACNVYISAGSERGHAAILLNLLQQTQRAAAGQPVGVVHAFCDQVYNRSSIHLVGQAGPLSEVAANLAKDAVESLRSHASTAHIATQQVHHPYVGFVDHVSVMPIDGTSDADPDAAPSIESTEESTFDPPTPSGRPDRR